MKNKLATILASSTCSLSAVIIFFYTSCGFSQIIKDSVVFKDIKGSAYDLHELLNKPTIVFFRGTGCPISDNQINKIEDITQQYHNKFSIIQIDLYDNQKTHPSAVGNSIVVNDKHEQLRSILNPRTTTEAFLINKEKILYRGAIDNQYSYSGTKTSATVDFLVDAINQFLKGEAITVSQTEPFGCVVGNGLFGEPMSHIEFEKNVAPIIKSKCLNCHNKDSAIDLNNKNNLLKFRKMMGYVVEKNIMPPWNPKGKGWKNGSHLSPIEKKNFLKWVNSDDKEIRNKLKDPPFQYAKKEYNYYTADRFEQLEYDVPEIDLSPNKFEGYKFQKIDLKNNEDIWIDFVEFKSQSPKAFHHAVAAVRPYNWSDPQKGFYSMTPMVGMVGQHPFGYMLRTAHLKTPVGFLVPAHSTLYLQLHYEPTGKPEKDKLKLVFYKYKKKPKLTRFAVTGVIADDRIQIPPNTKNVKFTIDSKVPMDAEIEAVHAHMHLRGSKFEMELFRSGKKLRDLIKIDNFVFNWQEAYLYSKRVSVKKNDILKSTAIYDNTKENYDNPDPNQFVKGGLSIDDEMMVGYYSLVMDTEVVTAQAKLEWDKFRQTLEDSEKTK